MELISRPMKIMIREFAATIRHWPEREKRRRAWNSPASTWSRRMNW